MMSRLHNGGVEIVSPTFMNQRAQAQGTKTIPHHESPEPEAPSGPQVEDVAFDKADLAESVAELERRRAALVAERTELEARAKEAKGEKDEGERERIAAERRRIEGRLESLDAVIRHRAETLDKDDDPS